MGFRTASAALGEFVGSGEDGKTEQIFLLRHWLAGFAYHVDVDVGAEVFFGAGVVAVLVAWATICVQVFRLAALHPVVSLRYE